MRKTLFLLGVATIGSLVFSASALQQTTTSAYECTQVALDDIDPALLTKEERIALLDKSLHDSINSYSTCVASAQQAASGGGNGKGKGKAGGAAGGGQQGQQASNTADPNNSQQQSTTTDQQVNDNSVQSSSQQSQQGPRGSSPTNRGVIPPKDNDKVICKLLFQEIQKTTDAGMLEGLKQQYANYKCG